MKIGVVGLGKIGFPLACAFATSGAEVVGVDIDNELVNRINSGICPVEREPGLEEKFAEARKNFKCHDKFGPLSECDFIIIATPTLLNEDKTPYIDPVISAAEKTGEVMKKGAVISFESTVPPGSTLGALKAALEKSSGMKAGKDFGLVFSPERLMTGQFFYKLAKYPKIVGAFDERSGKGASEAYSLICPKVTIVSSPTTAELVKLTENSYRDLSLAFSNYLALMCEQHGADVFEVLNNAVYPSQDYPRPGIGVGGHCIPIDPYYLFSTAEKEWVGELGRLARTINDYMPLHFVEMLLKEFKEPEKITVAVLGITFRGNVAEITHSPVLYFIDEIQPRVLEVRVYDPLYPLQGVELRGKKCKSLEEAVKGADAVVFGAEHTEFTDLDLKKIKPLLNKNAVICDGRNIFDRKKVEKLGLRYVGL